ncbi:MAG: translocase, partial [Planctomycetaceae bacterium]
MITASHIFHWLKSGGRIRASQLSRWRALAKRIIKKSDELQTLSDEKLTELGREIRWRAKAGTTLKILLPEAYALVREAARRTLQMQHFEVQIMGGIALFEGQVTEMQTGEGKTLTATMPAFLRALPGRGCYVITVNDYLAERDAKTMGNVYEMLGLSVGCILTPMEAPERRDNYTRDITYGTAKEMGFDFLRDRLRTGASGDDQAVTTRRFAATPPGGEKPVQREHYFALVDEADSILIDEARTPLIIGLTQPNDPATVSLFRWSHRTAQRLEMNVDFVYENDRRTSYLTDSGCRRVLLMAKPSLLDSIDTERIYSQVEKALTASHGFHLDRDYVVVDDKIVIVDEGTGRLMDGRKWQDGLHQAVEAKELVPVTAATGQAARITVQNFFRRFAHLAGMTGTAVQARRELRKTYSISVTGIPTNKPCIRQGLEPLMFTSQEAKRRAIVGEIEELH